MAILATGPELIVMHICMAIFATAESYPRKLLEILSVPDGLLMALFTIHLFVFPFQGEWGCIMAEPAGRTESFKIVTIFAACFKGVLVVILMTGLAIGTQAEISELLFPYHFAPDKATFMTILTFLPGMGTAEDISGEAMVEFLFIETDDLKIPAVVVAMATYTSLPP